jgi:hypothetical protein
VGQVAYQLALPSHSKLHPIFHVSFLKKVIGTKCQTQTNLPELDEEGSIWLQPQAFLDQHVSIVFVSASESALQFHFEGYKWANYELWRGKENSNLREKLLWRNYLLHIESTSLCPLSLNTMFNPQALPLLMENLIVSLI